MKSTDGLKQIVQIAKEIMEEKETHVVIVLDSSGSMLSIKQETIGAFNGFVDTIRENASKGGKTTVSLVVFGENGRPVKTKINKQPVDSVEKLTGDSYRPGAYTPMYDGIGTGINLVESLDDDNKNVAFLVQVFTDGMENDSREWTGAKLKERIQTLERKGNWTFTFAGANIDVNDMVDRIGIQRANSVAYNANAAGVANLAHSHNLGTQSYFASRGAGNLSMAGGFYNDSAAQSPLTTGDIKKATRAAAASATQAKLLGEAQMPKKDALDNQVKPQV
jgi:uncharacterized protein YegL